jgi:alpha-methylacyl-CoA racemase
MGHESDRTRGGPLAGVRVLELVGLGPGPFAGMLLADLGADVLRLDRTGAATERTGALERSKRSAGIDLRHEEGVSLVLELVARADVLIDVFRPGVTERLGIGPAECLARNPRLVYGRLTGFGQHGPLAPRAGHDIDFIAISGALDLLGAADGPPMPPVNILGDFAGGGLLLAFGVCAALFHAARTGQGQVVDAAMVDGAALLAAPFYSGRAGGGWGPRGTNELDGAAPFYGVYETADGGWLAVGAIEPRFYATLLEQLGITDHVDVAAQRDRASWPATRQHIADAVRRRTRDEWARVFADVDACVAPVLDPVEAAAHPHAEARGAFGRIGDRLQPMPAPRFSTTTLDRPVPGRPPVVDTADALSAWDVDVTRIAALAAAGVLTTPDRGPAGSPAMSGGVGPA